MTRNPEASGWDKAEEGDRQLTTPLPRIAARWRFGMNVKSLGWAANGDRQRYCDTRLQVCTTERQEDVTIQS